MTSPGQFNPDFMGFVIPSAALTMWRRRFSFAGLALGIVALFGGMVFLTTDLLGASYHAKWDMRAVLLGPQRC